METRCPPRQGPQEAAKLRASAQRAPTRTRNPGTSVSDSHVPQGFTNMLALEAPSDLWKQQYLNGLFLRIPRRNGDIVPSTSANLHSESIDLCMMTLVITAAAWWEIQSKLPDFCFLPIPSRPSNGPEQPQHRNPEAPTHPLLSQAVRAATASMPSMAATHDSDTTCSEANPGNHSYECYTRLAPCMPSRSSLKVLLDFWRPPATNRKVAPQILH